MIAQQGERLAAAAAEVEHRSGQVLKVGQIGGDPLADLLLRAAIAPLQLDVADLLVGAGDRLDAAGGLRRRRADGGERGAEPAQQVAHLAPVAVQLLVGAGEEGVVVAHHLVDPLGVEGLLVFDAPQVVGARRFEALQMLDQDEVEGALPLPEVVLGGLDQRAQEALEADQEPAEDAAMAADGERVVPRPEPSPVVEIAGGLDEEVAERRGALGSGTPGGVLWLRLHAPALPSLREKAAYSSLTTETVTSATTSGWSSTRTW